MDRIGANKDEMWDSVDGFFYDLLHFPNGDATRLKIVPWWDYSRYVRRLSSRKERSRST